MITFSSTSLLLQNLDKIHALEGFCSMAASGASSVKGGNFKIFEQFLAQSGANLFLNTSVSLSENLGLLSASHLPRSYLSQENKIIGLLLPQMEKQRVIMML